eukprot:GEMP01055342.1.p1 GENE.GEMP01055342.1~~GEMP01055342.1.p1  ORF type:complete len:264 (+),score=56.46 GEMP01055342.1:46-837(+)
MEKIEKPKKADYRQRAHCNPLSDFTHAIPRSPNHVDWATHFPQAFQEPETLQINTTDFPISYPNNPVADARNGLAGPHVTFVDVGCGFGGLLLALSPLFPNDLILGMEIREQVTDYVGKRILAMRQQDNKGSNISVIRTNVMKTIVQYFRKAQLEKMFFCFPDPQFKKKNWRRRIINDQLLAVYAYLMKADARIYCVTDVRELYEVMDACLARHPLFEKVEGDDLTNDQCVRLICSETEESKKVKQLGKFGHDAHYCVYRRLP